MVQTSQSQSQAIAYLSMEFLRRVVNELNGRRFEYLEEPLGRAEELVIATDREPDLLKVLPEVTRGFAAKIRPEFTRCHKLLPLPAPFGEHHTARDPIGGVSIRCLRHWHVQEGEFFLRFDAAFS